MAELAVGALHGALLICLAACATPPSDPEARVEFDATNDPAEPTNRTIFDANQFVDRNVLKPVAEAYHDHVRHGVQHGIHNFLTNLRTPIIGFNDLLQGNGGEAWTTVQRFTVNTAVGGFGIFDVAADWACPITTPISTRPSASGVSARDLLSSCQCSAPRTRAMPSALGSASYSIP